MYFESDNFRQGRLMAIKEGKPIVDTKEALDENNRKRKMNLKAVAKEAMAKNKRDYKE